MEKVSFYERVDYRTIQYWAAKKQAITDFEKKLAEYECEVLRETTAMMKRAHERFLTMEIEKKEEDQSLLRRIKQWAVMQWIKFVNNVRL